MTRLRYYEDAYLKELPRALVVQIDGNDVLLSETIIFPGSATEPGDAGTMAGQKVVSARKVNEDVWHTLETAPAFKVGQRVKVEIDWPHRYAAMRLHSALHLFANVLELLYGIKASEARASHENAELIYKHVFSSSQLRGALRETNLLSKPLDTRGGVEIKAWFDAARPGLRWIQIGSFSRIACGDLHVKNTAEIGEVKILSVASEQRKKVVQRIVIKVV